MSVKKKVDEQFLRLSMEHTLIKDYIQTFENILCDSDDPISFQKFIKIMKRFKKDLLDHFNLEERVLFPAALSCLSSLEIVDTVLLMTKEHGYLERDLDLILGIMQQKKSSKPALPDDLQEPLKVFTQFLKKHAQIEMESVFRPMDESRRCGRILKGFIIPS